MCNTTTVWQQGFAREKGKTKTLSEKKLSVMVDLEVVFWRALTPKKGHAGLQSQPCTIGLTTWR